jgi:hypothetical protein
MKHTICFITILSALAMPSSAQVATTPVTPAPVITPAVNTPSLPSYTVGIGPSWTRGGASPFSVDTTLGIHIGSGQWYSWTDISTPVATVTPGSLPVASTITTGGAWLPVQSASGSVSLVFIVQAGFSSLQATSTIAPAFTGSLGVAFRLGKSRVYLMPYAKASNATTSATSGALATAVFQPGIQLIYGFGGK